MCNLSKAISLLTYLTHKLCGMVLNDLFYMDFFFWNCAGVELSSQLHTTCAPFFQCILDMEDQISKR